jgi:hypothetical protein
MGYCSENDITKTLAQSLTTATADTPGDFGTYANLINVGNTFDKNTIPTSTVDYYIQLADNEIDGMLSELYKTPFYEKADVETTIYSAVDEYNEYIVVSDRFPLNAGDIVLLIDGTHEERHEISEFISVSTFSTVDPIQYFFPEGSRVIRISYPPPVRFISARLAAAAIYDKYFTAESSANVSKFGDSMRALAHDRINDILNGRVILHGQQRIGRRFYNPNLIDQYGLPKEGDMTRNSGR